MTPYDFVVQVFYQLANAFFWPVALALIAMFSYSLVDLGALVVAAIRRARQAKTELKILARTLSGRVGGSTNGRAHGLLDDVQLSPALRHFWSRVEQRLREVESSEDLDLWLDETLRREELELSTQLDRTRAFVRIGPMLGLAGTIIPLGPALQSLLGGDMAGMVNHLVVGFGAVVCGLVMSGIAYYITLIRERWARVDIKEMEDLCEVLMRHLSRKEVHATASVRTA